MHVAEPPTPGPWPGLVVVHELLGLNADIRRKADRFAARGYLVAAPDLFGRGNTLKCLLGAFRSLAAGRGPAFDQLEAVRSELATRPDCTGRVGIIGFCMGGGFALMCGARYDFAASAPNYGLLPRKPEQALAGSCPVVGSYGGKDRLLRGAGPKLDGALTTLGVEHDVKTYPGAGHSFLTEHGGLLGPIARATGFGYDRDAAVDTWRRIDAFLDEHVKN